MQLLPHDEKRLLSFLSRKLGEELWYTPDESWNKEATIFRRSCGCYSGTDTEPCSLSVYVAYSESAKRIPVRRLQDLVKEWAYSNLEWKGCPCCNEELYVNPYLFAVPTRQREEVEA